MDGGSPAFWWFPSLGGSTLQVLEFQRWPLAVGKRSESPGHFGACTYLVGEGHHLNPVPKAQNRHQNLSCPDVYLHNEGAHGGKPVLAWTRAVFRIPILNQPTSA